jgi:hypothetical protein
MMTWIRRRVHNDETGSLPLLMLVMLVGTLLTAAMMPVMLDMRTTTNFNVTRVRDLNAAQGATDAMIGKIRNAIGSNGGDPSKLPCTRDSHGSAVVPMTGTISPADGRDIAYYSVTVDYYVADPVTNPNTPAMKCVPGSGPYDSATDSVTPSYARIVATGTDSSTNVAGGTVGRTLTSIYSFEVDNSNISGSFIRIYPSGSDSTTWCLDAGDSPWTANVTTVSLQACADTYPDTAGQTFAYRSDLTLQLVGSIGTTVNGTTYRTGLCIDISNFSSNNTQPASNSGLVLRQCGALGSPVWSQQWSFDNYSSLQAPLSSTASTGTLSGLCMTVGSHSAGASVLLKSCDSNINSTTDAWLPSPAVGAGAAVVAPDTYNTAVQWINLEQFGRCINDPGDQPSYGFVIVASCKQNPRRASVPTNQFFNYKTSTKQMINISGGQSYCLQSPLTVGGSASSHIVKLALCNSSANNQKWTRTTPTSDPDTPYSQQYRLVDSSGQCLSVATVSVAGDTAYNQWSKLVTDDCDQSTEQQWNASNNVGDSSVHDVIER